MVRFGSVRRRGRFRDLGHFPSLGDHEGRCYDGVVLVQ